MFESLLDSVRTKLVSLRAFTLARWDFNLSSIPRQAKGIDRPSFSATLLKNQGRHGLDERQMAWLASTM